MSVVRRTGVGGLPKIVLLHPSGSTAEVYLNGAHVTSWVPADGSEALFLSRSAEFRAGTAIRGGVPVIFPQFGNLGGLPKHGFLRVLPWSWTPSAEPPDPTTRAVLRLDDSAATRAVWPHRFRAELAVELGERTLSLTLSILNTDEAEFRFTAALHTYLRLTDVRRAAIEGLQGTRYRDRMEGDPIVDEEPELVVSGVIDRVYSSAPSELRVHDRAGGRAFRIRSEHMPDVVVWNPGEASAAALPDMEAEEYRQMLCVEAAKAAGPVRLAPGGTWYGTQRIEVRSAGTDPR